MRARVIIVVALIAVGIHVAIFVALGRLSHGKPVQLAAPAAASAPKPATPSATTPAAPPATAPAMAAAPTTSAPKLAHPRAPAKRPRRTRPAPAAPPIFDVDPAAVGQ